MTPPPLEDRLNRLADGLVAPPTPEAREAIGHRTGVLRRRRRARQAAGVGALVLAAVAGSIAVTRDTAPEAQTDFADDGAAVPALTLDVDGWDVVQAVDTEAETPAAASDGSVQLFHVPGDGEGPTIVLRHHAAGDPVLPLEGAAEEDVAIGEVRGYLRQTGAEDFELRWAPPLGDNAAEIEARGLARDEVLAFARGLESRDDEIQNPPLPGTVFGFDATNLPEGVEEDAGALASDEPALARRVVAESASASAELTIEATGEAAYRATLSDLELSGKPAEPLTVMGEPGFAVEHPDEFRWTVIWQPRPATTAKLVLSGVDRAMIDGIVSGLREIDEDEWDALVTAHRA
jgi:hypothetical protein